MLYTFLLNFLCLLKRNRIIGCSVLASCVLNRSNRVSHDHLLLESETVKWGKLTALSITLKNGRANAGKNIYPIGRENVSIL